MVRLLPLTSLFETSLTLHPLSGDILAHPTASDALAPSRPKSKRRSGARQGGVPTGAAEQARFDGRLQPAHPQVDPAHGLPPARGHWSLPRAEAHQARCGRCGAWMAGPEGLFGPVWCTFHRASCLHSGSVLFLLAQKLLVGTIW